MKRDKRNIADMLKLCACLCMFLLFVGCTANQPEEVIETPTPTTMPAETYARFMDNKLINNGDTIDLAIGESREIVVSVNYENNNSSNITIADMLKCDIEYGDILSTHGTNDYKEFKEYAVILSDKQDTDGFFHVKLTGKEAGTDDLKILADDNEVFELKVNVSDVTFEDKMSLELWQYPYSSMRYYITNWMDERHTTYLRNVLSKYKADGGSGLTISICDEPWGKQVYDAYPSMIRWYKDTNGNFYYDFSEFEQWIALGKELGLTDKINAFSILPKYNRLGYYDLAMNADQSLTLQPGSDDWKYIWGTFIDAFTWKCEELGIYENVYICMDETDAEVMQDVVDLVRSHLNANGDSFKLKAYFNYMPNLSCLDEFEDISLAESILQDDNDKVLELINDRKEKGLTTTMYTCTNLYPNSFVYSIPAESTFSVVYAYAFGCDGFVRWALDAYTEDPYANVDNEFYESGDTLLVYPAQDLDVYESMQYAAINEGRTLCARLAVHPDQSAVNAYLQKIRATKKNMSLDECRELVQEGYDLVNGK